MIYEFEFRQLTATEMEDIKENSRLIDLLISKCTKKCANEFCKYPLPNDTSNRELAGIGEVCDLCYAMYHSISEVKLRLGRQRSSYGSDPA